MAGPEDETAAERGRGHGEFRASHADREQVIDVLKAAFVAGRLTKDELDLRVGQVLVSRTYADLAALTADIPAGGPAVQPVPAPETARETWRTVGWVACVMIPLVLLLGEGVGPAFILGFFASMMTAGCLIAAAAEQKHSRGQLPQGPAPGASGKGSQHAAPEQLPPFDHGQQHTAEAARSNHARPRSPGFQSAPQRRNHHTIGYAAT